MSFPFLKKPSDIPIVGQPCTFLAFMPTFLLQCNCDGHHPLLAVGVNPTVTCPGCNRTFTVVSVSFNAQTGQCDVKIGQVLTRDEAAAMVPAGTT